MKKLFAMILAMVMVLSLAACAPAADNKTDAPATTGAAATDAATTGDQALQTIVPGKLTMSTNAAFPPYEMTDDNGNYIGIDVEIATAIAEKLGLELDILDMDFSAALLAVNEGKSDIVMAGVTVNEDRKVVMDFTNSYATGVQMVIVKEGSDVTMDNLGDMMIGAQAGTTGYIYSSDSVENGGYGEDHVTAYDTGASAILALMNDQIDCVIIDSAPAEEFVKANPGLTLLEGEWVTENYAIGCDKGNTALVDAINEALAELTADGTVQQIVDKYISAE